MTTSYTSRLGNSPEESIKAPCVASTPANITLSGEQTIDGVAVVSGDRVLVRSQTDNTENGIYDASTSAWTRSTDWNDPEDVINGMLVADANATNDVIYKAEFTGAYNPGTTAMVFSETVSSGLITYTGAAGAQAEYNNRGQYDVNYMDDLIGVDLTSFIVGETVLCNAINVGSPGTYSTWKKVSDSQTPPDVASGVNTDGFWYSATSSATKFRRVARTEIDNVAALKLYEGEFDGQQIPMRGYYVDIAGGGQQLFWDATSTETANDGTIFQVTGVVTGRWKSVDSSSITAEMFGVNELNAGSVNTTRAQAAVDFLELDSRGGTLKYGKGNFSYASTVFVQKNGIRLNGDGPASTRQIPEAGFTSGTPIFSAKASIAGNPIGLFKCTEMKFDDTNNTGARGIEFAYLLYDSEFSNLDFNGFTSSCIYTTDRAEKKISESILFYNIKMFPETKTITEPPMDLFRINESLMMNCKFFGKQYAATPYASVELLKIDRPQQFNIISNSFANTNASAIKIHVTDASQAQHFKISDCHFEDIDVSTVIDVQGFDTSNRGNYGIIEDNRYLEITNPTININNWTGFIVRDQVPAITLGTNTNLCYVETLAAGVSGVTDSGADNITREMDTDILRFKGISTASSYLELKPIFGIMDHFINSGSNKIRTQADYQGSSLQRFRFLYDGTTDMGGFTNHGVYTVERTSAGAPSSTAGPDGTIVANSNDNKLYVLLNGVWKSVALV